MTVPVVQFVSAGTIEQTFETDRPYTLVYDGACKICGRLSRLIEKWDTSRQIRIIPSQMPGVHARFPWIPAKAYTESIQFVTADGTTLQGAAAVEALLDLMPKGRLLSWIFSIPLARPLAEKFYRWFARNRYRLGCGEHCQYRPLDLDFKDQ